MNDPVKSELWVLIVDDDDELRTGLATVLRSAGYSTLEAATGEEGLLRARDERPDLVLLDVRLPDTSGYDVCARLRETIRNDLPIVFMSGERIEPLDRTAGLLIGADDYLVKPFDPGEMIARIGRLLAPSHSSTSRTGEANHDLTRRELDVLRLLGEGLTSAQIARELVVSPKTVSAHAERVLAKLAAKNRAEAVAIGLREGII